MPTPDRVPCSKPMLTLKPLAAANDFAAALARIPRELLALAAAGPPWTSFIAFDGEGFAVGTCAFKGAPNRNREVEITYLTFPEHERRGYGTAMARALIEIAASSGAVDRVVAQTLPEENASARICRRLGFEFNGAIIDPDDGNVWRWKIKPRTWREPAIDSAVQRP